MAIKRYIASKDNTITNAYKPDLINRGTGSNMGESDSCEVFHIYNQQSTGSHELSRILVQFPVNDISSDRSSGFVPASGSVNFYLKMFNAKHPFTVPKKFTLSILPVSRSWDEGFGMDMESYKDLGISNWEKASSGSSGIISWTTEGGDFHSSPNYSAYFDTGCEDLETDITSVVEQWLLGTKSNYGFCVKLTSSLETSLSSSYTKKFFTRGSEFHFLKPIIEARWDSSVKDNRANFIASSSLAAAADNLNDIYFYNFIRGQLKNIPGIGTGAVYVRIWDDRISGSLLTTVTGGFVSTGIYSASVALNTTASYVYDRWHNSNFSITYYTGSIKVNRITGFQMNPNPRYVTSIPYVKETYDEYEFARFRPFSRERGWCPNIYTKANAEIEGNIIEDSYYKIKRIIDDFVVVDYGTGSLNHTRLSYDVSGSYFDFDMGMLEPGYSYEISFLYKINNSYQEQKEKFKFRVD